MRPKPGEFRTNVSQGGVISLDNIPDDAVTFAVKIARMCRLNDVGLDIYCYQGAYGVLELNMKYGKEGFRQATP